MANVAEYDLDSVYSAGNALVEESEEEESGDDEFLDREPSRIRLMKNNLRKLPVQILGDLKVAEVLARNTLCEAEDRQRLKKIQSKLEMEQIKTGEMDEAMEVIIEIEKILKNKRPAKDRAKIFESIKETVERDLTVENLDCFGPKGKREIDVSLLAMELLDSSEDSGDESCDEPLPDSSHRIEPMDAFWRKEESVTGDPISLQTVSSRSACSQKITNSRLQEERNINGPQDIEMEGRTQNKNSNRDVAVTEMTNLSAGLGTRMSSIEKNKMIIALKKRLFRTLKVHLEWLRRNPKVMKHKVYQLWCFNMGEALKIMDKQIAKREEALKFQIESQQLKQPLQTEKSTDDEPLYSLRGEASSMTEDQLKEGLENIYKKRAILFEKHSTEFFAKKKEYDQRSKNMANSLLLLINNSSSSDASTFGDNQTYADIVAKCLQPEYELSTRVNIEPPLSLPKVKSGLIPKSSKFSCSEGSVNSSKSDTKPEQYEILANNALPFINQRTFESCFDLLKKFLTDAECKMVIEALNLRKKETDIDDGTLQRVTTSNLGEENFTRRRQIVFFFKFKPCTSAIDVQDAYSRHVSYGNNGDHVHGCLLLYTNVGMGITMVEGSAEQFNKHFASFKHSDVHKLIEIGRILFCRDVEDDAQFDEFFSINVSLDPGKVTYLNKDKKILKRVAEPRVFEMAEKLTKFFKSLANVNNRNVVLKSTIGVVIDTSSVQGVKAQMCGCQKDNYYFDASEGETTKDNISSIDILPSPALIEYLLKYKTLKSLDRFLDDLVRQPLLESDDDVFDGKKEAKFNKYVLSDEEEDDTEVIGDVKRTYRYREILNKVKIELKENLTLEATGGEAPWVKEFELEQFTPQVAQVEIRRHTLPRQSMKVSDLVDTDESEDSEAECSERYMEFLIKRSQIYGKLDDTKKAEMAEKWRKLCVRFGLTGRELKEMLADAQKFKELRKEIMLRKKMEKRRKGDDTIEGSILIGEGEDRGEVLGQEEAEYASTIDLDIIESIIISSQKNILEDEVVAEEESLHRYDRIRDELQFNEYGEYSGEYFHNRGNEYDDIRFKMFDDEYPSEIGETEEHEENVENEEILINEDNIMIHEDYLGKEDILINEDNLINEEVVQREIAEEWMEFEGELVKFIPEVPKSASSLVDSKTGP